MTYCPSILLMIASLHMCIMVAVLLNKVVVQHFIGWMHITKDGMDGQDYPNNLGDLCVNKLA